MSYLLTMVLITLYAFTIGGCIFLFKKDNRLLFLHLSLLLILFICRTIIDDIGINSTYLAKNYPHLLNLITIVSLFLYILFWFLCAFLFNQVIQKKSGKTYLVLPTLISIYMLLTFVSGGLKLFFFLPGELYLIYLAFQLILYSIKKPPLIYEKFFLKLGIFILIGVILAGVEQLVLINSANIRQLSVLLFNQRHLMEDFFCLIISLIIIKNCFYDRKSDLSNEEIKQFFILSFETNPTLSNREKEVLGLVLDKKTNQEIAELLYISVGTVKTHTYNIFKKLNVRNRKNLFACYEIFCKDQLSFISKLE